MASATESHQQALKPPDLAYMRIEVNLAHVERLLHAQWTRNRMFKHRSAEAPAVEAVYVCPQPFLVFIPQTTQLAQAATALRDHRGRWHLHGNTASQDDHDDGITEAVLEATLLFTEPR